MHACRTQGATRTKKHDARSPVRRTYTSRTYHARCHRPTLTVRTSGGGGAITGGSASRQVNRRRWSFFVVVPCTIGARVFVRQFSLFFAVRPRHPSRPCTCVWRNSNNSILRHGESHQVDGLSLSALMRLRFPYGDIICAMQHRIRT